MQTRRRPRALHRSTPLPPLSEAIAAACAAVAAGDCPHYVAGVLIRMDADRELFRVRLAASDRRQGVVAALVRAVQERTYDDGLFISRRV